MKEEIFDFVPSKEEVDKMTLKEALKMLNNCGANIDYFYHDKVLELINKALTPPTEEEVCKALSEYNSDDEVVYLKEMKEFYNLTNEFHITETYDQEEYSISMYLPPHLITLIGRFYENENS